MKPKIEDIRLYFLVNQTKQKQKTRQEIKQLLENIIAVTSKVETGVLQKIHVLVNALTLVSRKDLGEVTLGVQSVNEGHPFGPRVVVVRRRLRGYRGNCIDRSGGTEPGE